MPYSMSAPPQWSKSKSKAVQKVAVDVFNETFKKTGSESKARRASLAAQKNAEESFKKSFIIKSVNEELMQALFVVMVPNEIDLHGDVTTEDEIRKACHNFNKFCRKANLFHMEETDSFDIVESWVTPVSFELDNKIILKGTWLCTVQVEDMVLWQLIKSGDICSVSIGAVAKVETLDD